MNQPELYIAALKKHLDQALPGEEAQSQMAPEGRRLDPNSNTSPPRLSAVLIPLARTEGDLAILFTVRQADLNNHGGEVSFPGGAVEDEDKSCADTALREAEEEIDLPPCYVEVLGELTPLYIPPTHYCVHPLVGWIPDVPPLHPNDNEVARILTVPLAHLLDPAMVRRERWTWENRSMIVPFYEIEDWPIWGATAMMLNEFLVLSRSILESPALYD